MPDDPSLLKARAETAGLLQAGQPFLAHDCARAGLAAHPGDVPLSQLCARALVLAGGYEEAREVLLGLVKARFGVSTGDALADASLPASFADADHADAETLGLLARTYKESWKQTGSVADGARCRDLYALAFRHTGDYWTGINAASMARVTGDFDAAARLAHAVLAACEPLAVGALGVDAYYLYATIGEARLLLGDAPGAADAYRAAQELATGRALDIASSRAQLALLGAHGVAGADEIDALLPPPGIAAFDQASSALGFASGAEEMECRAALASLIAAIGCEISYSSAAAGAEIVFTELMIARGGEVNLVLPYAKADYVRTSVAAAGPSWAQRFESVVARAASVKYVTGEPFLGDTGLRDFGGLVCYGQAVQRASVLRTRPSLLAAAAQGRVEALAEPAVWLRQRSAALRSLSGAGDKDSAERVVRAMVFADVVGYSRLSEEAIPHYMYVFLRALSERLREPPFINTWGDAIFGAGESATEMAGYALGLRDVVCETDWPSLGLPQSFNIRIALHAGPVFRADDPLTNRPNYYGSHVNRVARMEPVTLPGCVYATEQFVALLTAEQLLDSPDPTGYSGRVHEVPPSGRRFRCDYIGPVSLAKSFGAQVVYHLCPVGRID